MSAETSHKIEEEIPELNRALIMQGFNQMLALDRTHAFNSPFSKSVPLYLFPDRDIGAVELQFNTRYIGWQEVSAYLSIHKPGEPFPIVRGDWDFTGLMDNLVEVGIYCFTQKKYRHRGLGGSLMELIDPLVHHIADLYPESLTNKTIRLCIKDPEESTNSFIQKMREAQPNVICGQEILSHITNNSGIADTVFYQMVEMNPELLEDKEILYGILRELKPVVDPLITYPLIQRYPLLIAGKAVNLGSSDCIIDQMVQQYPNLDHREIVSNVIEDVEDSNQSSKWFGVYWAQKLGGYQFNELNGGFYRDFEPETFS